MGWALGDAERQQQAIHAHDGASAAAAPARSVRRATARRASNRRATARSLHGDSEASIIIDFLAKHPGSTAGDVAKGLNLDPGSVSARLTRFPYSTTLDKPSLCLPEKKSPAIRLLISLSVSSGSPVLRVGVRVRRSPGWMPGRSPDDRGAQRPAVRAPAPRPAVRVRLGRRPPVHLLARD